MSKKKKIKIVLISIVIVIVLIFLGIYFSSRVIVKEISPPVNPTDKINELINEPEPQIIQTVLEINGVSYEDEITGKISVYDFMSKLQNEGKINFTAKNYTGMGEFIEGINGINNNNNQSWIYYVNGKEAGMGVSNYKINGGDVVSWKYEKSDY